MQDVVGVLSLATYIPKQVMTSQELTEKTAIPQQIIEDKLGIIQKTIATDEEHTAWMGIQAAKKAISLANVNSLDIDVVIYIGEEHKEYPLWTAGIYTQEQVGATNAWAFDVQLRCSTTVMALKLAKSLILGDADIRTVLLAGGYRNHDYIDYSNDRTRFMFNLAAGGGAIILQKGYGSNLLLATHTISDGSFSEDVAVTAGGTKYPISPEMINQKKNYLDVFKPKEMKERLEQKSIENFIKVVTEALRKSGLTINDIDYLATLHMKRSAHDEILSLLHLDQQQSIYLSNYGHIGQIDQILSIELALEQGKIKDGDIVVLVSAGIGYAWSATVVKWGKV